MSEISDNIRKEFVDSFGASDALTTEVIAKLQTLKSIFNLNTEDIFLHWETYNVNEVEDSVDLSLTVLDSFQEYLQNHLASLASKNTPAVKKSRDLNNSALKRRPLKPINSSSPMSDSNFQTPALKSRRINDTPFKTPNMRLDSSPSQFQTANNTFQKSSPFSKPVDKDSNTVIESLNSHLEEIDNDFENQEAKVQIATNFDASKYKFRTMSMKLLESADMLDEQIDYFAELFQENHKGENFNFANPCLSSQFDIHCCGRIVPDSPSYDKLLLQDLNATSLYLETSRLSGIGQRVPLDLSHLKEYAFFPGQIVCLEGRNPTGSQFIVQKVLSLPELAAPVTPAAELKEYKDLNGLAGGLKFVVAAGPFSNSTTLNYDKFETFVDRINSDIKPDVVVLLGPFVDLSNKSVLEGDLDFPNEKTQPTNLDEVFKKTVTPVLKKIDSKIQVILLPSLKDATVKHCSYPQDSMDRKLLGLPKNVKMFPNPSGFSINEILFGCSNLDVFKDLKDVFKKDDSDEKGIFSNRFERVTNHIFQQRRYYPTFPGSMARNQLPQPQLDKLSSQLDGVMAEEISQNKVGGSSLEVPYMGLAELGDTLPDVLIIPSELKYFARVVKNVVVINPGSFIRPNRDPSKEDGTYVVMNTKAPEFDAQDNIEKVNDSDLYYHNVFKRSKIDIYKS